LKLQILGGGRHINIQASDKVFIAVVVIHKSRAVDHCEAAPSTNTMVAGIAAPEEKIKTYIHLFIPDALLLI
jgi:hypothetical protein